MKEIDLKHLKEIQLKILDYIHEVCKKNEITYFLDAGTLLGAVRHKGYIPWDDDIDLCMPRKDYMKLIEVMGKERGRYRILSHYLSEQYYYPFMKIVDTHTILKEGNALEIKDLGVYVDVFPLDSLPEGKWSRRIFHERVRIYRSLWGVAMISNSTWVDKSIRNKIIFWYAKKKGPGYFIKKSNDYVTRGKYATSKYMVNIVGAIKKYPIEEKVVFDEATSLEFEGKMYDVPKGYAQYLTTLYGDYMTLPPEEQRITHHHFKAYYKKVE